MPPIHVISLDRTPERRAKFSELNQGQHFEFVRAIDGRDISPLPGYTRGASGCALSHRMLWEEAAETGPLTIAEDDAIFHPKFAEKSAQAITKLPFGWDIIIWAWNFDSILAFEITPGVHAVLVTNQGELRESIEGWLASDPDPIVLPFGRSLGTPSYTVSRKGANKLIQGCFPMRGGPVFFCGLNRELPENGIDIAMNRLYPDLSAYACIPPLAVTPNINEESLTR